MSVKLNFTKSLFYHNTAIIQSQIEPDVLPFLNKYIHQMKIYFIDFNRLHLLDSQEFPTMVDEFKEDKKLKSFLKSQVYSQKFYQLIEHFLHFILQRTNKICVEDVIDSLNHQDTGILPVNLFLKVRIRFIGQYEFKYYDNDYEPIGDPQELLPIINHFIETKYTNIKISNQNFIRYIHKIVSRFTLKIIHNINEFPEKSEQNVMIIIILILYKYHDAFVAEHIPELIKEYQLVDFNTSELHQYNDNPEHLVFLRKTIIYIIDKLLSNYIFNEGFLKNKSELTIFLELFFIHNETIFGKMPYLFDRKTLIYVIEDFREQEKSLEE